MKILFSITFISALFLSAFNCDPIGSVSALNDTAAAIESDVAILANNPITSSNQTYWNKLQERLRLRKPAAIAAAAAPATTNINRSSTQQVFAPTGSNCSMVRDNYANRLVQRLISPQISAVRATQWITNLFTSPIASIAHQTSSVSMLQPVAQRVHNMITGVDTSFDGVIRNLQSYLPEMKCSMQAAAAAAAAAAMQNPAADPSPSTAFDPRSEANVLNATTSSVGAAVSSVLPTLENPIVANNSVVA